MSAQDAELVRRCLAGDRSAYEGLITTHLVRAQAVARAIVGDHAGLDDVVQNAFVRAYDRLGQLSDPGSFAAWLSAIVRNEATTWLRNQTRRRQVGLSQAEFHQSPTADEDPDLAKLHQALAQLPTDYREVLALKYEADCDYQQIAETLGISVANVEKRLYRARQALIKLMPDLGR